MVVEWIAALVFVAAPTTVVSVSNLEKSLPEIKQTMAWASAAKPDLSPVRANKFLELLKIDLFNVRDWVRLGLDKDGVVHIWHLPEHTATVIELSVKNSAKVDELIRTALEANASARKVIKKSGVWLAPAAGQFIAAVRIQKSLFLQLNRPRGKFSWNGPVDILSVLLTAKEAATPKSPKDISFQDARLAPMRSVIDHRKPKVSGVERKRSSDIWIHRLDKAKTYMSGPIRLGKTGIELDLLVKGFDHSASKIFTTLKPKFESRRLFDTSALRKVGGEIQANFTLDAMRGWGADQAITVDISKVWTGEFHAVLLENGALLVGVPIRKEATRTMRAKLSKALVTFDASLKQSQIKGHRGEEIWLIWWGDVSEKSMKKLAIKSKPVHGKTLVLQFDPPRLLTALRQRSLARDNMRLPGAKLFLFELLVGQLMRKSSQVKSEIMVSPGQTSLSMKLLY